jgi:hypothetical protein
MSLTDQVMVASRMTRFVRPCAKVASVMWCGSSVKSSGLIRALFQTVAAGRLIARPRICPVDNGKVGSRFRLGRYCVLTPRWEHLSRLSRCYEVPLNSLRDGQVATALRRRQARPAQYWRPSEWKQGGIVPDELWRCPSRRPPDPSRPAPDPIRVEDFGD